MEARLRQRDEAGSYPRATYISSILAQAAVVMGFVVYFEPALCDILAVLALVAGLPVLGRNIARLPRIVVISLLVFISINVVGLISAISVKPAIRFFGITAYLIAFSILIYSLTWEKDGFRQHIVKAYMIAAFVTATLIWAGLFSNILNLPLLSRMTYADRPMGLFKDPNVAGSFLIPGALFLSATILEEGRARSVSLWGALFLIVSAVFHTASRSAVLCWGLGLLVLTVLSGTSLRRKLAHLAAVACIVLLVLPVMYACTGDGITIGVSTRVLPHMGYVESLVYRAQHYIADIAGRFGIEIRFAAGRLWLQNGMRPFAVSLYEYDTGGRVYAWQAALELWRSRPLIGIGPGEFELLSPDIQRKLGASFITASAHSTYLRVLAENGVIGLASLVIPLIFAAVAMGRAGSKNNALWLTGHRLWLTASLIALIANGLFIDSLHFRHLWLVFALALREVRSD
jgi:hypothetical protein